MFGRNFFQAGSGDTEYNEIAIKWSLYNKDVEKGGERNAHSGFLCDASEFHGAC